MKHRYRHLAEYAAVRGVAAIVRFMPYRASLGVGWIIAAVAFHLLHWRRGEAEHRIREVFGRQMTQRDVKRVAWISMRNLVFNAIEMITATRIDRAWVDAHTGQGNDAEVLLNHVRKGQGAILAVAHSGNWDAAGIGMDRLGVPMMVIVRQQKNPLINDFLNAARSMHGSRIVDRNDRALVKKVVAWLNDGNVVAVLVDLRASVAGTPMTFLDRSADIGRGVGLIARLSRAPVYPAITLRNGWTQHSWTVCEPISSDRSMGSKADTIQITQSCLDALGAVVLDHPEQYFWYNKRWVLQPIPRPTE